MLLHPRSWLSWVCSYRRDITSVLVAGNLSTPRPQTTPWSSSSNLGLFTPTHQDQSRADGTKSQHAQKFREKRCCAFTFYLQTTLHVVITYLYTLLLRPFVFSSFPFLEEQSKAHGIDQPRKKSADRITTLLFLIFFPPGVGGFGNRAGLLAGAEAGIKAFVQRKRRALHRSLLFYFW
jgi:hypothetical protein